MKSLVCVLLFIALACATSCPTGQKSYTSSDETDSFCGALYFTEAYYGNAVAYCHSKSLVLCDIQQYIQIAQQYGTFPAATDSEHTFYFWMHGGIQVNANGDASAPLFDITFPSSTASATPLGYGPDFGDTSPESPSNTNAYGCCTKSDDDDDDA